MPTFSASAASTTTVSWTISGLSNPFNQTYYQRAVLSTSPTGSALQTITAPSTGSSTSTGGTTSGGGAFSPGSTYTLWGYVVTASGASVSIGSDSVTMPSSLPSSLVGHVYASKSTTYAPATINFSWDSSSGATSYDYSTSSGGAGNTSSTSISIGSKPAGTYSITVTPKNSSGSGGSGNAFIQLDNPPPLPGAQTGLAVTVSGSAPPGATVNATWNSVSNATQYDWSTNGTTSDGITSGAVTGLSKSITVTSVGTWSFTVTPRNTNGTGTPQTVSYNVPNPTPPPLPGGQSGLAVNVSGYAPPGATVNATWNAASNATSYDWSTNAGVGQNGAVTGLSKSITVTDAGTWSFTVTPRNSTGTGPAQTVSYLVSNPPPPPLPGGQSGLVVSVSGLAPNATVNASWNAASNATSYDWLTNAGAGQSGAVTTLSKSIIVAVAGTFSYTVTPRNSTGTGPPQTVPYTVTGTRPANFAWTNAKISGQPINVTEAEWDSFISKINAFRAYKSLSIISFIPVTAGVTDISANICNQARNAINDMNTAVPSLVTANVTTISASYFNGLVSSLNSIP